MGVPVLHEDAIFPVRQQGIPINIYGLRLRQAVKGGHHLLLLTHELILVDKHRHGVNAGRHMLKGKAVVLKSLQYLAWPITISMLR